MPGWMRRASSPRPSQPNPSEFAEHYRMLSAEYDAIISMHVTAKLSGTYQSATIAADMVKDEIAVYPFDSAGGSASLGFMADEALAMLDQGQAVEAVLERLDKIRRDTNIFFTPDNLKYAYMSGRISALESAMASLLNIKPIVVLKEGELFADERVRTRKRAFRRMVEMMQERLGSAPVNVAVIHAIAPKAAESLLTLAKQSLNVEKLWLAPLSTSVAVHLGPGTIGLGAYRV